MRDERNGMASESEQTPQRGSNDVGALKHIVERHAKLAEEIQAAREEQKELEQAAWERCGYSAKAIKQLSKESAWDEVKREARRQLEEEIDKGRAALGMLADTPLGEAEMERMEEEKQASHASHDMRQGINGSSGEDKPRKPRGRPPGSKNKAKSDAPAHPTG